MGTFAINGSAGINFKSYNEIRSELQSDWKNTFGNSIELGPTSPDGLHVDLEAKTVHSILELLQGVIANFNANTASGVWLDYIGFLIGVERNGADDEAYRNNILNADLSGLATYDGMLTYLRSKLGSDAIELYANEENSTDEFGVPAHSVMAIIPTDIAENDAVSKIWMCKPAGIKTYGNVTATAYDSCSKPHSVSFSRPEDVTVYVRVNVTNSTPSALPNNAAAVIREQIVNWAGSNLGLGNAVYDQQILSQVTSINGINRAEVYLGTTAQSQSYSELKMAPFQKATIASANIYVTGVS